LVNLDTDYKNIQGNFQQLDTSFGVNHVPFSVTPNNGKHKFVEMPVSAGIPAGLAAGEGTVYTQTLNANSNLVYTNNTSNNGYQLSRCIDASYALFGTNTSYGSGGGAAFIGGWTFLPGNVGNAVNGGMLLQYGLVTGVPANSTLTVTFPIPFTRGCYSLNATPITSGNPTQQLIVNAIVAATGGVTNFVINNNSSTFTKFYWQAVGI